MNPASSTFISSSKARHISLSGTSNLTSSTNRTRSLTLVYYFKWMECALTICISKVKPSSILRIFLSLTSSLSTYPRPIIRRPPPAGLSSVVMLFTEMYPTYSWVKVLSPFVVRVHSSSERDTCRHWCSKGSAFVKKRYGSRESLRSRLHETLRVCSGVD
jgi:hypothetical protein